MTLTNLDKRPSLIFMINDEIYGKMGTVFYDNDKLRATLMLDSKGNPELKFRDKDKKFIWSARQDGLPVEDAKP